MKIVIKDTDDRYDDIDMEFPRDALYDDENIWHRYRAKLRETEKNESNKRIFAFLDLLGFKDLLKNKCWKQINYSIEDISDELYQYRRRSALEGFIELHPSVSNFSDTILLHSPYVDLDTYGTLSHRIWSYLISSIRAVIIGAIRQGIALRGGISVGTLFASEVSPLFPDKVTRHHSSPCYDEVLYQQYKDAFGEEPNPGKLYNWSNGIVPFPPFNAIYGESLLQAYNVQEGLPAIGVFIDAAEINHIPTQIVDFPPFGLVKCDIDGKEYYAVNWCFGLHSDHLEFIKKLAAHNSRNKNEKVANKWLWLKEFIKKAPK